VLIRQDILGRVENEDDPAGEDPDEEGLQKLQEIMNDLVIKQAPKRVQFSIPLKIGGKDGDIEIGISGYVSTGIAYTGLISRYALVSEQGKGQPKYVRMRGQTVEEVVTRSEYTSAVS
jgi:ATP-dependent DNA helicase 2 subunit 1